MYLTEGSPPPAAARDGAVRLLGAHIGGQLDCDGRSCATTPAPPWHATACKSARTCTWRGFTPPAVASTGAVRLACGHFGGQLSLRRGEAANDSGPALRADRLHVGQDMYLRGGFTATGSGKTGAVRLPGAHIGGNLECDGAKLHNDSGPALQAGGLQV